VSNTDELSQKRSRWMGLSGALGRRVTYECLRVATLLPQSFVTLLLLE
jgi:hypothetical protein